MSTRESNAWAHVDDIVGVSDLIGNLFGHSDTCIEGFLKVNLPICITPLSFGLFREAGKPVSAGDVAKVLKADRKEVDKAFAELKKEGAIVSPVRCKWEPAK